jgi:membrane-associated phospholipid phosphatase
MNYKQFLRENRSIFYILIILPLFFLYLDKLFIILMRDIEVSKTTIHLFFESVDPLINVLSNGMTLIIIACMLYAVGKFFNRRLYEAGKTLCLGFLAAGGVTQILKHLIGRARPRVTDDLLFIGPTLRSGYDSFPSGHTAVAFCFAYILSTHFPRYRSMFYIIALIIGFERAEESAHFLSDILGGALVGLIAGKIVMKSFQKRRLTAHSKCVPFLHADTATNSDG